MTWLLAWRASPAVAHQAMSFPISDSVGCRGLFFFPPQQWVSLPPNRDSYHSSGEDVLSPDKSRSHGPITGMCQARKQVSKKCCYYEWLSWCMSEGNSVCWTVVWLKLPFYYVEYWCQLEKGYLKGSKWVPLCKWTCIFFLSRYTEKSWVMDLCEFEYR